MQQWRSGWRCVLFWKFLTEATGAVVKANSGQKAAECYVKRNSAAARERWKSGRHGASGGGDDRDIEESEDGAGNDGSRYAGTETDR